MYENLAKSRIWTFILQDHSNYFVTAIQAGLQSRAVVTPLPDVLRPWQCIFLQSGSIKIDTPQERGESGQQIWTAPAILYWPFEAKPSLLLSAGSTGVHLALEEMFLISVIGKRPEAQDLREAALTFSTISLEDKPLALERINAALGEIALELEGDRSGQLLIIEAQLRCLLIQLWRHTEQPEKDPGTKGLQLSILRKFRQLVETHFHDRWGVANYAEALNITADRLHNIATQTLQKTPLELIHERSHREARALLTRTNMTLDQIAEHLNFKSTQQFSAFFRKFEKMPPGKFRSLSLGHPESQNTPQPLGFGDWP